MTSNTAPARTWTTTAPLASDVVRERIRRWSARQAARGIEDDRRFLFLAMTAGHPVCPANAMDQVWHQHLRDSRAWGEECCPQVLGRVRHHSPSKGREEEERFPCDPRGQRVETGRCWLVPRPRMHRPRGLAPRRLKGCGLLALALVVLALSGCEAMATTRLFHPLALSGPEFLLIYGVVSLTTAGLVQKVTDGFIEPKRSGAPKRTELSPLEIAFLMDGEGRAVRTALLGLVLDGRVALGAHGLCTLVKPGEVPDNHPLERQLLHVLRDGPCSGPMLLHIVGSDQGLHAPLRERLVSLGLLNKASVKTMARASAAVLFGAVWVLGIMRWTMELTAGRPVGFLSLALLEVTRAWLGFVSAPLRHTTRGVELKRRFSDSVSVLNALHETDGTNWQENKLRFFACLGWVQLAPALEESLRQAGIQWAQPPAGSDGETREVENTVC